MGDTARKELHDLVDALPPGEEQAARRYLEYLRDASDPYAHLDKEDPFGDMPEEEHARLREALERGEREIAAGESVAAEDLLAEEVLHPGVLEPVLDHRVELLGDDRLPRVGANPSRREAEEGRVVHELRSRRHGVTDADVDLERDPRFRQPRLQLDSKAPVLLFLPDQPDTDRVGEEDEAIGRHLGTADLPEDGGQACGGHLAAGEQVEILRRPGGAIGPRVEEHRALEDEVGRMRGGREAVEEPLVGVADQDPLEILALRRREVEQPLAHRGVEVGGWPPRHRIASR